MSTVTSLSHWGFDHKNFRRQSHNSECNHWNHSAQFKETRSVLPQKIEIVQQRYDSDPRMTQFPFPISFASHWKKDEDYTIFKNSNEEARETTPFSSQTVLEKVK